MQFSQSSVFALARAFVVIALAPALAEAEAQILSIPGQGTWETELQPRELDGNLSNGPEAYYDTALKITWLRNANAINMESWYQATNWASSLVVGGISGWRLPNMVDTGESGCNFAFIGTDCGYNVDAINSEMAHLWYITLGNTAYLDATGNHPPGWGATNVGVFENLQTASYWTGVSYSPDPSVAWLFHVGYGYQGYGNKGSKGYAIAVHDGDVASVPEPHSYIALLSGLGVVAVAVRRRRRK